MIVSVIILSVALLASWILLGITLKDNKQLRQDRDILQKRILISTAYRRNLNYFQLLQSKKIDVKKVLESQSIRCISIYGMGNMGKRLLEELSKYGVDVCYGIDQKNGSFPDIQLEIRKPQDIANDMDMIFVTPEIDFDEIHNTLRKKVSVPIILLKDFLEELLRLPESLSEEEE